MNNSQSAPNESQNNNKTPTDLSMRLHVANGRVAQMWAETADRDVHELLDMVCDLLNDLRVPVARYQHAESERAYLRQLMHRTHCNYWQGELGAPGCICLEPLRAPLTGAAVPEWQSVAFNRVCAQRAGLALEWGPEVAQYTVSRPDGQVLQVIKDHDACMYFLVGYQRANEWWKAHEPGA